MHSDCDLPGSAAVEWQQRWQEEFDPCVESTSDCVNGLRTSIWNFEVGDGTRYGPNTIGELGTNGQGVAS